MGFGPPEGDPEVWATLREADQSGAMTFALPGAEGSYAVEAETQDPFIHQEMIEMLYHTLWETVHVFFEHRELGHDLGNTAFLYPFLGQEKQETGGLLAEVAASIQMKVHDDSSLRARLALEEAEQISNATHAIHERILRGGKLILFGNGGSATDANDWAIDCVLPPLGYQAVPAVSLSLEPANITAVANDVGTDVIFLRQLIAQAQPDDVAIGISTSGGSRNIIMALEEARKQGLLTVALLGYDGGEIKRQRLADFSARGPLRLHSPHPGRPGLHVSHHSRIARGAPTWPSLNCMEPPAVRTRRRCESGSNGSAPISLNTTWKKTHQLASVCWRSLKVKVLCLCWSRMAK